MKSKSKKYRLTYYGNGKTKVFFGTATRKSKFLGSVLRQLIKSEVDLSHFCISIIDCEKEEKAINEIKESTINE